MYKVWSAGRQQKKLVFAENVIDLHLKGKILIGWNDNSVDRAQKDAELFFYLKIE